MIEKTNIAVRRGCYQHRRIINEEQKETVMQLRYNGNRCIMEMENMVVGVKECEMSKRYCQLIKMEESRIRKAREERPNEEGEWVQE